MNEYAKAENEASPELQPFDPRDGDDFNTEQRRIDDWANAGSGYIGEVIATTSVAGVRAGIDMANRVALEHENRAAAARRVEKRLREELSEAAQHGYNEDETTTVDPRLVPMKDEPARAHLSAGHLQGEKTAGGPRLSMHDG